MSRVLHFRSPFTCRALEASHPLDALGDALVRLPADSSRFGCHSTPFIHAECIDGDIDLLCNRRAAIGFFPWRFVDGESSIGRCAALVEDDEYEELMALEAEMPKTRFGDGCNPAHVERIERPTH